MMDRNIHTNDMCVCAMCIGHCVSKMKRSCVSVVIVIYIVRSHSLSPHSLHADFNIPNWSACRAHLTYGEQCKNKHTNQQKTKTIFVSKWTFCSAHGWFVFSWTDRIAISYRRRIIGPFSCYDYMYTISHRHWISVNEKDAPITCNVFFSFHLIFMLHLPWREQHKHNIISFFGTYTTRNGAWSLLEFR